MALLNFKTTCPSCKEKFSPGLLKKPKIKKYEGTLEAGECPHCKTQLEWFHDKSKVMRNALLIAGGISIGSFIGSGRGSIIQLIGTFIGAFLVFQFMAVNQLKVRTAPDTNKIASS